MSAFIEFDESDCTPECQGLCDHFEAWYRAGMSAAWKQIGQGLSGILATLDKRSTSTKDEDA